MQAIWQQCNGQQHIGDFHVLAYRVVDSDQAALVSLVDDADEQDVLEALLDNSPSELVLPSVALDALLARPFRQPQLAYPSRFGDVYQPGIFYAALKIATALAECAYYRWVFLQAMDEALTNPVHSQHHSFAVSISTTAGVQLDEHPFTEFEADISHPGCYQTAQNLGLAMRQDKVAAFSYVSARTVERALNIGVFEPAAISSRRPKKMADWACYTDAETVKFTRPFKQPGMEAMSYHFAWNDFLVDGEWPSTAF